MSREVHECGVRECSSAEWLLQQFDVLADVPNGVQKLRELILQLAVQGKLVPQDPSNEPASVLLERIEAEEQRLYEEGKIGKPKALPPIDPGEVPFEVPEGWEWVRLGDLGYTQTGTTSVVSGYKLKSCNWL